MRTALAAPAEAAADASLSQSARPKAAPRARGSASVAVAAASTANVVKSAPEELTLETSSKPQRKSDTVIIGDGGGAGPEPKPTEKIARASSSGGQSWGVSLGRFKSRDQADERLIQVAMQENAQLDGALRHIRESSKGYEATFVGLSKSAASKTCASLSDQGQRCDVTAP